MGRIAFGSTGLMVEKNGFGALPVQRRTLDEGVRIIRLAYDGGVEFFDTARNYTDSESKIGLALSGVREKVVIACKTHALDVPTFWKELEISLANLRTDYIDIHQFHNPPKLFRPGDGTGMYEAFLEAKRQGKIRHIGISSHNLSIAREAVESGLFVSLQYPFSYLATDEEVELVRLTYAKGMGFICMKALSGGLVQDFFAANAFIAQFPGAVPIWGIQHECELDDLLACIRETPVLTPDRRATIDRDRIALSGEFCRGCGYCLPCPSKINIPTAARMKLMLRRAPLPVWTGPAIREMMKRIPDCIGCNHCEKNCPYHLEVKRLLKDNHRDFKEFVAAMEDKT